MLSVDGLAIDHRTARVGLAQVLDVDLLVTIRAELGLNLGHLRKAHLDVALLWIPANGERGLVSESGRGGRWGAEAGGHHSQRGRSAYRPILRSSSGKTGQKPPAEVGVGAQGNRERRLRAQCGHMAGASWAELLTISARTLQHHETAHFRGLCSSHSCWPKWMSV